MKQENNFQILLSYRTHRQVKNAHKNYDTRQSPVPNRKIHDNFMLADFSKDNKIDLKKAKGLNLFIPNDISYEEYLEILEHAYKSPMNKNVFEKIRTEIKKEVLGG